MNRIVYFADRAVAFAAAAPGGEWHAVRAADGVTRAKILKILESYNSVAVLSPDPEAAFAAFAAASASLLSSAAFSAAPGTS